MTNQNLESQTHKTIILVLRVLFIGLLLLLSFKIITPFLMPIIWGIIISIGIFPLFNKVKTWMGGRSGLASSILVVIGISILVVPFAMLINSAADSISIFVSHLNADTFKVPPPPSDVADWPIIGQPLFDFWEKSSINLEVLIVKVKPYLTTVLPTIFSSAAGVVGTIFQFIFSIIIAGLLLVNADAGKKVAISVFNVIIGDDGAAFVELSKGTIKGVVQGVIGTAIIQSAMIGLGFFAVGLPGAGILTVITLFVSIIQLPPSIIVLPVVIYVFGIESSSTAIIFTVWSIIWSASDNVIKPMLMGRGVDLPMIVILIGAIGRMWR
jgi:predicted PurR-regulated permease PerM